MDAMERWLTSSSATCSYVSTGGPKPGLTESCCEAAPPAGDGRCCGPATDRTAADVSTAGGALAAVLRGIEIVTLQPYSVEDIFGDVRRIAAALGVPERGEGVVRQARWQYHTGRNFVHLSCFSILYY